MEKSKNQLKKIAFTIAKLEHIIQTSDDSMKVKESKEKLAETISKANLGLNEIITCDEMVRKLLKKTI